MLWGSHLWLLWFHHERSEAAYCCVSTEGPAVNLSAWANHWRSFQPGLKLECTWQHFIFIFKWSTVNDFAYLRVSTWTVSKQKENSFPALLLACNEYAVLTLLSTGPPESLEVSGGETIIIHFVHTTRPCIPRAQECIWNVGFDDILGNT